MRGAITTENLEWFEPLMTQTAAELIKAGAPVYAIAGKRGSELRSPSQGQMQRRMR